MKLPVEYRGYKIEARLMRSGVWILEASLGTSVRVTHRPAMQAIYIGDGSLAYDCDIAEMRNKIDNRIKFDETFNRK